MDDCKVAGVFPQESASHPVPESAKSRVVLLDESVLRSTDNRSLWDIDETYLQILYYLVVSYLFLVSYCVPSM